MSSSGPTWFLSLGAAASDKERVAVIKKDTHNGAHSASMFLSSNTTQFFSQPVPDYQARGDVKNRSFFIYRGSMPVAEVRTPALTSSQYHHLLYAGLSPDWKRKHAWFHGTCDCRPFRMYARHCEKSRVIRELDPVVSPSGTRLVFRTSGQVQ